MHDCQCLIMGEKMILNLRCCKPKATAVDLLCSENQALSLKAEVPPSLWMGKYVVIPQDLVNRYESGRQLKLWYVAHPNELALGSHSSFLWTEACISELTGSSFHSVEKGRSEMDQHSYKTSTIYKPSPQSLSSSLFLLRDWGGVLLLPLLGTRKYQQLHRTNKAVLVYCDSCAGHFWWGCRSVPAEPSDKLAVRAEAPRLCAAGFKCQSTLKAWSFFTQGLLCVTQEAQCPHHSNMTPSQAAPNSKGNREGKALYLSSCQDLNLDWGVPVVTYQSCFFRVRSKLFILCALPANLWNNTLCLPMPLQSIFEIYVAGIYIGEENYTHCK